MTLKQQTTLKKAFESALTANKASDTTSIEEWDPLNVAASAGIFLTRKELDESVFSSNNDKLIRTYSIIKEEWFMKMFYDPNYNNIRKEIAEQFGFFSKKGVLDNLLIITPTPEQIDKMFFETINERKEKRANEIKELLKRKEEFDNGK